MPVPEPEPSSLRRQVRAAFDALAPVYDAHFGGARHALMAWLRRESLTVLRETFQAGSRLLDIGCGTGEEAVALAQRGDTVWVTDIAPGMVRHALRRAREAGVAQRVRGLVLPAGALDALQVAEPFDGAYASFGALNCEPDLVGWARSMARLIRPGGALVCSVINRWCLWETVWFILHRRPREAVRRWRRTWDVAVLPTDNRRTTVPVRYLTAHDIARLLGPAFRIERVRALPLLLPPPYLDDLYRRWHRFFSRLEPLERLLRDRRPWCHLGDHAVIVARRVP